MPVKDYALRLLSSSSTERYKEFPASPKGKKEVLYYYPQSLRTVSTANIGFQMLLHINRYKSQGDDVDDNEVSVCAHKRK